MDDEVSSLSGDWWEGQVGEVANGAVLTSGNNNEALSWRSASIIYRAAWRGDGVTWQMRLGDPMPSVKLCVLVCISVCFLFYLDSFSSCVEFSLPVSLCLFVSAVVSCVYTFPNHPGVFMLYQFPFVPSRVVSSSPFVFQAFRVSMFRFQVWISFSVFLCFSVVLLSFSLMLVLSNVLYLKSSIKVFNCQSGWRPVVWVGAALFWFSWGPVEASNWLRWDQITVCHDGKVVKHWPHVSVS